MFIALRDLAYAKGRFLLMGLVVALVAYLMTLLSGLSENGRKLSWPSSGSAWLSYRAMIP